MKKHTKSLEACAVATYYLDDLDLGRTDRERLHKLSNSTKYSSGAGMDYEIRQLVLIVKRLMERIEFLEEENIINGRVIKTLASKSSNVLEIYRRWPY